MSVKDLLQNGAAAKRDRAVNKKTSVNASMINNVESTIKDQLNSANQKLEETKSQLVSANSEREALQRKLAQLETEYKNNNVGINEFESKLAELNVGSLEVIDPSALSPHPVYHNRTTGYFQISHEQEIYFRDYIAGDRLYIEEDADKEDIAEVHIDKFFSLVIAIYKAGKNHTAICYTEETVDGKTILCPIFGESRWQAVKWLHDNGFTNNGEQDVTLIGYRSDNVDSLKFKMDRLSENTGREDLQPIELAIQIYDLYKDYTQRFENGEIIKARNQRPEGYAIQEIHSIVKKSHATVKKFRNIGRDLGTYFTDEMGLYANYVSYLNLRELTALINGGVEKTELIPLLKDQVIKEVEAKRFDINSISISNQDKMSFINEIIKTFLNKFKAGKSEKSSDSLRPAKPNTIECRLEVALGFECSYKIDKDSVVNPTLKKLLSEDPVAFQDKLADHIRNFIS